MGQGGRKTVVCVIGTRPEAIKIAPVIRAFRRTNWARCSVLLTGQHRELVDDVLEYFGIEPDIDLDVMRLKLPLERLAPHLVTALSRTLACERPDMVLAQGDTTSVLATALACFQREIPFGHIEAGLRSHRLFAPYPEEANRVVAAQLSTLHFTPTRSARLNLEREGIAPEKVFVIGNTVIDALLETARRDEPIGVNLDLSKRLVLVTAHRRDSFGEPMRQICLAVGELHDRFPNVEFLWPIHPNPNVRPIVERLLKSYPRVRLCEPLAYGSFVAAMKRAWLILTDSGGVQEEAPALCKPVLVMRNETERPEAIEAGVAKLVGLNPETIVAHASRLLEDQQAYQAMSLGISPYGDGRASQRIVATIGRFLGIEKGATNDRRWAKERSLFNELTSR